jgi:predicted permease
MRIETLTRDVRYAVRRLSHSPGFTIIATLSLALGIGANTAAVGVLNAVLFRPLPVRDPAALALVEQRRGGTNYSMSYPAYTYLRDHATRAVAEVIAFRDNPVSLSAGDATATATGVLVSGNYFEALGVAMLAGSSITPDDDRTPGSGGPRGPVAVISEQCWTQRFGRDPAVIGRQIRVEGEPLTVIGIVPASFRGTRVGALPDVFMPMMFATKIFRWPNTLTGAYNHWLRIMIRKQPDASFAQAEADMTLAYREFNREFIVPIATSDQMRQRARQASIILHSGRAGLQEMRDRVQSPLFILMGLMLLVWLIASVNVASLTVARAERHHRDTAIHLALGASSARLWSQQLVESALLGAISVALGLILATWMRTLLVQLVPANQAFDLTLDTQVIAGALLLGAATTMLVGVASGWQSTRRGIVSTLKGDDLTTRFWLRKVLIVGQFALSIVVLVAAALFGQTLRNLRTADIGFEREHLLLASLSTGAYPAPRQQAFYTQLLEKVRATPGVTSVALSGDMPLNIGTGWAMKVANDSTSGAGADISADISFVSRDFFKTIGLPLIAGRIAEAMPGSAAHEPLGAMVNETLMKQALGGQNPLGVRLAGGGTTFEITGVVKDSATRGFRREPEPLMYVPLEHSGFRGGLVLYVRSSVPPETLAATIETLIHRDDPEVPIRNMQTMEQYLDVTIGRERTFANLSSSFGLLALLLSGIGLYGMLAYAVSRRTKELGIRLALGASPRRLVRMVMSDAGTLIGLGLAIGMPLAFALGGTIRGLLYGVQPGDWRSLSIAALVLVAVSLLAAWLPARRAAAVDPLIALRHE